MGKPVPTTGDKQKQDLSADRKGFRERGGGERGGVTVGDLIIVHNNEEKTWT